MAAFPPQRIYNPTALSIAEAKTWISTYLANSESTAYLQPDALLTSSGPIQAQGMSSVTIHNLKRLRSGLNGKYDATPPVIQDNTNGDHRFKGAVVNVEEIYNAEGDWQDKSEFEREQSVEMGDIGESDPSHGTTVKKTKPVTVASGDRDAIDKKARKQAKKDRRKKQKAENQKKSDD